MSQSTLPVISPYDRLGGEAGLRRLVHRFYTLMDTLDEAKGIRDMHPPSLAGSEEKLFMFLSGWLGGPQLYVEAYGPPMLRRRHLHFPIGSSERDQWMLCMDRALDEQGLDETVKTQLREALMRTADHMRNQPE
ncbi:globin [Acidihalobacter aeolianus]|uniref:Globin n=1 Tax=Acidihalobacter aeolianus TaxID=2792603 RepID=A0A1D8K4W7_9GAMM|nr:group II truncated hemoglobin [Acidihalobacter aeolianus]AOV15992.1 globin [Acidihalobacter aeolianus]